MAYLEKAEEKILRECGVDEAVIERRCTDSSATVCDPACGSGSLLIRAIDAPPSPIMGYGQEKESTTAGLAKMNAVLHHKAEITIKSGNTFSNPQYLDKSDNSLGLCIF